VEVDVARRMLENEIDLGVGFIRKENRGLEISKAIKCKNLEQPKTIENLKIAKLGISEEKIECDELKTR
jgi:DNA-binding protein